MSYQEPLPGWAIACGLRYQVPRQQEIRIVDLRGTGIYPPGQILATQHLERQAPSVHFHVHQNQSRQEKQLVPIYNFRNEIIGYRQI